MSLNEEWKKNMFFMSPVLHWTYFHPHITSCLGLKGLYSGHPVHRPWCLIFTSRVKKASEERAREWKFGLRDLCDTSIPSKVCISTVLRVRSSEWFKQIYLIRRFISTERKVRNHTYLEMLKSYREEKTKVCRICLYFGAVHKLRWQARGRGDSPNVNTCQRGGFAKC